MRTVLSAIVLAAVSTAAFAQYDASDPRSNIYNNESLRRQDEIRRNEEAARTNQNSENMYGSKPSSPSGGSSAAAAGQTDYRALGKELLRLPPLPVERNVLLGNWRLEGGGQQSGVLEFGLTGRGATPGFGEMMGFMKSIESGQLTCDMSFGRGITFTPTTFSSGGAAGMVGGPVAYRSRKGSHRGHTRRQPREPDVLRNRRPGSHSGSERRLPTSAGRCASGQRRGECDERAGQCAYRGCKLISTSFKCRAASSRRCACACAAAVNAGAAVAGGLPQQAPRQARRRRRQSGAGDV